MISYNDFNTYGVAMILLVREKRMIPPTHPPGLLVKYKDMYGNEMASVLRMFS